LKLVFFCADKDDCKRPANNTIPDSIVRTSKINERNSETALNVTSLCASRIPKSRYKLMENMERLFGIWIEDPAQHHVPLSLMMIQE
jgi:hypothetical protein